MEAETEPLTYILNYYRERIENNEEERRKWYETLDKIRIPQEYDHRLRWEHKKRTEELQELENAVKNGHYSLYDYRDKINNVRTENEDLLEEESENRKTIKDLLALNNSVEQHVHFSEGASPERLLSYAKNSLGKNVHQREKENMSGNIKISSETPKVDYMHRTPNILRTVYLENSDLAELRKELEELQTEILTDHQFYEDKVHEARNDKAKRDEYYRQELISDNNKLSEHLKDFEDVDNLSIDTL
mmetsp:Transcript_31982/g.28343  ORF Transcript_31982/g.28343 Transcript_31982/m.28343 type:complete len:246 (-) Transcript_31982:433-1170(-)